MLSGLLFIFYFAALLFLLWQAIKRKQIDISFRELSFIYSYKVLMGCAYGYIFLKIYNGDDTWMYHQESLAEYQKLIHHPVDFFKDLLPYSAFNASHNFWQGMQFYIQDLEYWFMIKLLGAFNIFSRGNYYINVLFFDAICLTGILLLDKLFNNLFLIRKKILIIVLFFLPLVSFWLSGIRAEGLLLLFISLILFYSDKWFNYKKKLAYIFYVICGVVGCIIFRGQLLLIFTPAFFCLTIGWRNKSKAVYYFISIYAICIIVFLGSMIISPEKNLSMPVISRQQEFLKLHGNTSFKLDSLQPSPLSFVIVLPQAFSNTFLRPFMWEAKGILQLLTSFDIIFFWACLLIAVFFRQKKWRSLMKEPLFLFCLFYGVSQIIFIGYIVPFLGAIVRYKSIPELFLFLAIALLIKEKSFSFRNRDLI